jgi:hypothetical protein
MIAGQTVTVFFVNKSIKLVTEDDVAQAIVEHAPGATRIVSVSTSLVPYAATKSEHALMQQRIMVTMVTERVGGGNVF